MDYICCPHIERQDNGEPSHRAMFNSWQVLLTDADAQSVTLVLCHPCGDIIRGQVLTEVVRGAVAENMRQDNDA